MTEKQKTSKKKIVLGLGCLAALIAVLVSIPMEKALLPYYAKAEQNEDE